MTINEAPAQQPQTTTHPPIQSVIHPGLTRFKATVLAALAKRRHHVSTWGLDIAPQVVHTIWQHHLSPVGGTHCGVGHAQVTRHTLRVSRKGSGKRQKDQDGVAGGR